MWRWWVMLAALAVDVALAVSGAWIAGECVLGVTGVTLIATKPGPDKRRQLNTTDVSQLVEKITQEDLAFRATARRVLRQMADLDNN